MILHFIDYYTSSWFVSVNSTELDKRFIMHSLYETIIVHYINELSQIRRTNLAVSIVFLFLIWPSLHELNRFNSTFTFPPKWLHDSVIKYNMKSIYPLWLIMTLSLELQSILNSVLIFEWDLFSFFPKNVPVVSWPRLLIFMLHSWYSIF